MKRPAARARPAPRRLGARVSTPGSPRTAAARRAGAPSGPRGPAARPGEAEAPRARDLRVLNAVAEALNSAPDVQRALDRTLAMVADLLGLRTGWVWLRDPETGRFYNAAARNLPPYLQEPVRMAGRPCWCLEQFRAGELTPKNIDVLECSRLRPAARRRATALTRGLAYHASVPLYFQNAPLGIMNLTGPAWRRLDAAELRLLSTIAYQVGIAIERARLAEDAARLARAEERASIAREIHDTLAQALTAIALHLESAVRHLDRPGRARAHIERALDVTRQSLEDARRSVLDLRAAPLEGKALPEALAALARRLTAETGVRVRVRAPRARALPPQVESELFRITREALANVRRHAGATEVVIALGTTPGRARLTVRDNGAGFAPGRVPDGRLGIVGMRERARLLGGRLRVRSAPGRGTTIAASVPLAHAKPSPPAV